MWGWEGEVCLVVDEDLVVVEASGGQLRDMVGQAILLWLHPDDTPMLRGADGTPVAVRVGYYPCWRLELVRVEPRRGRKSAGPRA